METRILVSLNMNKALILILFLIVNSQSVFGQIEKHPVYTSLYEATRSDSLWKSSAVDELQISFEYPELYEVNFPSSDTSYCYGEIQLYRSYILVDTEDYEDDEPGVSYSDFDYSVEYYIIFDTNYDSALLKQLGYRSDGKSWFAESAGLGEERMREMKMGELPVFYALVNGGASGDHYESYLSIKPLSADCIAIVATHVWSMDIIDSVYARIMESISLIQ